MDQPKPNRVIQRVVPRPRPWICQYVSDNRDSTVQVDELATRLVTADGSPVDETNTGQPGERIYLTLHHVHLPALDDVDVVDYDYDRRHVGPAGNLPLAEDVIEEQLNGRGPL